MSLKKKALKIKAIILDIDGVMTNGMIGFSNNDGEVKFFNARDGLAIVQAIKMGYKVGVLSGRKSIANDRRIADLGLSFAYQGFPDKKAGFELLLKEQNLVPEECLFIGDDLIDIPVFRRAGIAVTVADAYLDLDKYCDFRTKVNGGNGAVQEVIYWLLKEVNRWDELIQKYLN